MSINKNLFNFFSVTVFTAIVTILSIYFLTKKLDVEAFAIFGLLSSVTTFANGVISSSATFIFSRKNTQSHDTVWKEVYSTSTFTLVVIYILYLLILFSTIFFFDLDISQYKIILVISFFKIFFDLPTNIFLEYFRIIGNSKMLSYISMSTLLISILITFLLFFLNFDKKILLFVGPFISSIILFIYFLFFKIEIKQVRYSIKNINMQILKSTLLSSSLENFYNFFEKLFLTKQIGLYNFGIYNHSAMYKQYFGLIGNSFANSIWNISLKEAQENDKEFRVTRKIWNIYYFLLFITIVLSVLFSKYFLEIFTHGIFIKSYQYIPLLLISFFLINSGKEDTAYLYSFNYGNFLNANNSIRIIILITTTIISVPFLGIYGAILALFLSNTIFRLFMFIKVRTNEKKINYNYNWLLLFTLSLLIYVLNIKMPSNYIFINIILILIGCIYGLYINLSTILNYIKKYLKNV